MLSKKKTVETQYMGTSGKYVKKETAKPWRKSTFVTYLLYLRRNVTKIINFID